MLKDRQLLVSPEPPSTVGVVTAATDSTFRCEVLFRGKLYSCYSAGKNTLAVNDLVSFWEIDGLFFCSKADAGYPTRFRRPMIEWAATHPHNLLLQYCVRKQANIFTYRIGAVEAVASEFSLIVGCWDGVSREMTVEYAGTAKSATAFSVGEPVVCFRKATGIYVVIGKLASITVTPDSIDFGNVAAGGSSDPVAVDVEQVGSTESITVSAPSEFAVSTASGGTYGSSIALPGAGGIFYAKSIPLSIGAKNGNISMASVDASAVVAVSAQAVAAITLSAASPNFITHVADDFQQFGDIKTITMSASGLTGDVTLTVSGDFVLAPSSSGPWAQSIIVPTSTTTLYARMNPVYSGYSEVISNTSSVPITRSVSGTITAVASGASGTYSLIGTAQEINNSIHYRLPGVAPDTIKMARGYVFWRLDWPSTPISGTRFGVYGISRAQTRITLVSDYPGGTLTRSGVIGIDADGTYIGAWIPTGTTYVEMTIEPV